MTFCGPDCVHEWKLRTQPAYQARHVLERDAGVCASCGLDCVALLSRLRAARRAQRLASKLWSRGFVDDAETLSWERDRDGPFADLLREVELPRHLQRLTRRLWEMDHTRPVAEGGGACGLDNLRTLCWACHARATAELAARRARRRKPA
jgi:5-methylcytosine-specific restriction endonuclease McrA